jgi:hypothetical protein
MLPQQFGAAQLETVHRAHPDEHGHLVLAGLGHAGEHLAQRGVEATALALAHQGLHGTGRQALHLHEPDPQFVVLAGEDHLAAVDVGKLDFQAQAPRLFEVGRGVVVAALVAQDRGHELGRPVALEVDRLEAHHRVGRRVCLAEGIAREALHLTPDFGRHLVVDGVVLGPLDELGLEREELLGGALEAHGAAHEIGLAQGEPADDVGHAHHVLLVDHHTVGLVQEAQVGMQALGGLHAEVRLHEAAHHAAVAGTGTDERGGRDHQGEAVRL